MVETFLPLSALLRRELLRHLRRLRVAGAVAFLVLTMFWVLWRSWPEGVLSLAELKGEIESLLSEMTGVYAIAAFVVLPGYAAMSIRSEHNAGTYELMRLTLLTPASIVLGTLANVLGLYLLAVVATLPLLFSVSLMTPQSKYNEISAVLLVLVSAAMCTSAGLYASTLRRKTSDAVASAYAYAIATVFLGSILASIFTANSRGPGDPLSNLIIIETVCAGLFLFWTIRRLRDDSFERSGDAASMRSFALEVAFPPGPRRRPRTVYRDGRNPVFVREFGDALYRARINPISLVATVILAAALFVGTYGLSHVRDYSNGEPFTEPRTLVLVYFNSTVLLAAALIPGISTPAWTNDRNTEMEEALDLTLLTRRQRFLGRACAAAALPCIVTACWVVGFAPFLRNVVQLPHGALIVAIGFTAIVFTLLNLFALGRSIARTPLATASAVIAAYFIATAYLWLPSVALPDRNVPVSGVQAFIVTISPYAAVASAAMRGQSAMRLMTHWALFTFVQTLLFAMLAWVDIRPDRALLRSGR